MEFFVLDFETKDPYIGLDLGAGFPFAINYPEVSLFYPIGWSDCVYDSEAGTITPSRYYGLGTKSLKQSLEHPNLEVLKDKIKNIKNVVCHNAQYDLGCLMALGIDISHLRVYDTKVMGQLYDSTLYSYSLSALLTKYHLGEKIAGSLSDIVKRHALLRTPTGKPADSGTKTYAKRANDFAYSNMDLLQELEFDTMANYANHDTMGTARLFKFFYGKIGDKLSHYYSNVQKICTKIRARGIRVDLDAARLAESKLVPDLEATEKRIYELLGRELNLRSKYELPEALIAKGYQLPLTDAGNESVNKEFLEEHPNDELCQLISKQRTLDILLNSFVRKTIEMQQYSDPYSDGKYGRVFPEMNLLAARTGRFSSSNPNIQNIPKRNKEYAKLCRAMFVPDSDDKDWNCLDWSNQEGRLQLHYAVKTGLPKAQYWLRKFEQDPKLDTHRLVAEMMYKVPYPDGSLYSDEERKAWEDRYRTPAKTIYLGKSFCMGRAKTAKRLGLPTEMITIDTPNGPKRMLSSGPEATKLILAYDDAFPYLKELQKDCTRAIKDKGYIKTLGGRRCGRPRPIKGRDMDYKAISLLIQGSAADQMYAALTLADEAGLNIKCIVHDEFNIEGTIEDAKKMQEIMTTCVDILVPSIAEIKTGKNWGNLEKLKEE